MQEGIKEKKHRKQKRYQNIWTHGKGRKAVRKGVTKPIAHASRALLPEERNYS